MSRGPWLLLLPVVFLSGCATTKATRVDLQPARQAVAAARDAGAAEKAPDCMKRAQDYLGRAEAANGKKAGDARWLSELAISEARCASQVSAQAVQVQKLPEALKAASEADRLQARLKKSDDEHRRLEDEVALLSRDLELTENEIIRLKAKLRGLDSKAEASSAIAEARILMNRYQAQRGKTANLERCQELVERAEQQILEENFGAAAFFAQKAEDLLQDRRRPAPVPEASDRPAPKKSYTVRVPTLNIRATPGTDSEIVGRATRGDVLEAGFVRGDWLSVTAGDVSGWVYRTLVD
jgi:hypothetical protein